MGDSPAPLVSVVIPAYNAERTIGETLAALAAQRLDAPWEILVCDNGSSDDTAGVIDEWRDRLPPVTIVDASHRRGPSAAMNTGARTSRAEFLVYCDADDVVADDWLETFVEALRTTPYVGGHVEYDRLRAEGSISVSWNDAGPFVFTLPAMPGLAATGSGNFGIRRDLYLEVGGFEEALESCEDADFSWRVQLTGAPLVICDTMYHVRTRQSLRSIARQGYHWGAYQPTLRRRWALVAAAVADDAAAAPAAAGTAASSTPPAEAERRPNPIVRYSRTIARRIREGRVRSLAADVTWQTAHRLGRTFGKVDESVEQIPASPAIAARVRELRADPWRTAGSERTV
ncbi:glycosyltransferase [Agromyces seonyuensis]|uniref:Glycosyltransferase n=1 Tax=Agromyces seonyuensis TaxID=2662446 RepID=A0A6I4P270_9MICO|nr:glycosyltransferase [Agromyces seonyuensis]MWB97264.1 glycosyltransferase [Agromyces seonyuensis]